MKELFAANTGLSQLKFPDLSLTPQLLPFEFMGFPVYEVVGTIGEGGVIGIIPNTATYILSAQGMKDNNSYPLHLSYDNNVWKATDEGASTLDFVYVRYTNYISGGPIPVEGDVQIFADAECTQYATGTVDRVYVRVNVPWGFGEGWTDGELEARAPDSEFPDDPYWILYDMDIVSNNSHNEPFTAGQVVELNYDAPDPIDITDFQKVFSRPSA